MNKVFKTIHLWLSVPFGLIITVICFSGAMLVFEKEVTELVCHDLIFVDPSQGEGISISAAEAVEAVAETLPEGTRATGITIFSDPSRAWQVSLSQPRRAFVYVDQYTGEVKGRNERLKFFTVMFRLHRWLLDSMKPDSGIFWGKLIVGISTLMFVLVLISGVVIWWPKTAKMLKTRLKIVTGKGWKRFWYDLHVAGGAYALVFLLAMALTGLTWSFDWYRTGFYKVFGAELSSGPSKSGPASPSGQSSSKTAPASPSAPESKGGPSQGRGEASRAHAVSYALWQEVYEELASANPGYKSLTVSDGSASVNMGHLGNRRAADSYSFDRQSGEITKVRLYKDAEKASKIRGWIYSVHVGSWGGLVTRVLAFLAALLGATLPLTGYYLWLRKFFRAGK